MAEQRGDGTPVRLHTGEGDGAMLHPFTGVGRQENLPYYLFQSELRHRKVTMGQGLSRLLDRSVSLLCSSQDS